MGGDEREFRVKNLYDIARILRTCPAGDAVFDPRPAKSSSWPVNRGWRICRGLESFIESWPLTSKPYETDRTLAKVFFGEAEHALKTAVGLFDRKLLSTALSS